MKTVKTSKKWFFAILSMIFFSVVVLAVIIDTDTFNSDMDGWSKLNTSDQVYWSSGRLFINQDDTAIKTYDFGSTYANKDVTITLTATKTNNWESSDKIEIRANGTLIYNSNTGGSISFNVTLDSNGILVLRITPNTSSSNEDLYIDNISIDYDPVYTSDGFVDFSLVNPSDTRNIIGNYAIAGNTVMCLTEKTSGYGGTCHGQNDYQDQTSNMRVSKYIDIDGDSSTWNSTSSYIQLPTTYDESSSGGIAWAGLFWQGRIATDKDYVMHYGVSSGGTYSFTETGSGSTMTNADIKAALVNAIKLKIDAGSYNDIQASTVNSYASSNGVTYAAFADVTNIARSSNMNQGKHVFTVANLVTNEGREASPGLFGGWSLVVIYKENSLGRARNISIYNGLTSPGENTPPVHISGLKLPKSGVVSAQLSVFAGEGEALYRTDWMKLSDKESTGYSYLPGATDNSNMFDAVMDGVTRDNITGQSNNLQANNDGVDIDRYDISSLMTGYRDANSNIEDVYIKLYSDNDYITPSMLAFSAELYRPNLCYDFEATQGDSITVPIASDRSFTPINNDDFYLKLFVRSQESDFLIQGANLGVDFNRSGILQFDLSKTKVQPPHVNAYQQAILIDGTSKDISIGSNNSITGGTISAYESIYAKIGHNMITGTNLPMRFDATVKGSIVLDSSTSTLIPFALSTSDGSLTRCMGSAIYNPRWLQFNIERPNTSDDYRLYTQVTGRQFAMDVVSYSASSNYTNHENLSNVVTELELIDVGSMENNSSQNYDTVCEDVDKVKPWLNDKKVFQIFNGSYRVNVNIPSELNTYAIKNAAMRVWTLTDGNGTIVHHTCTDVDHSCFKTLYTTEYSSLSPNNCGGSCGTSNTDKECYECLKTYYATPACSRDNFSVRPDGFRIRVGDNNQTTNSVSNWVVANQNNPSRVNLVSGYNYPIEINATRYGTSEIAQGYYQTNSNENDILNSNFSLLKVTADLLALVFDDDTSACNDTKHVQLKVDILNGINDPTNSYIHRENVGKFNLAMIDNTWTQVDQAGYAYKPFTGADCIAGSGDSEGTIVGCSTLSDKGTSDFSTVPINFVPAKIAVNMTASSPLNLGWLYMNNINADKYMAVKFDGNLTAVNYKNVATSNFVNGCAAKDVNLSMDFNNSMSSMVAENIGDHNTTTVNLKYGLRSNGDANYTYGDANASGFMQIKKSKFLKDNNGSSPTEILYNIEKIFDKVLNPVKIWFKTLISMLMEDDNKTATTAYAEMKNNFTIDDNKTYNKSYIFLYGRVFSPLEAETPTILTLNTQTALSVLAYCDGSVDCSQYNSILETSTTPDTNWYRVKAHTSSVMGMILSLSADKAGTTISPNTNVGFVNNGTTDPITIGYPMTGRTQVVRITVAPSTWLNTGNPFFDIKFAIPSYEWFGVGKTGGVVNTRPVPDSKRLSW